MVKTVRLYFFEREMVSGTLWLNRFVYISLNAKWYQFRRHELPKAPRLLFVPFTAPPAFVVRLGIPGSVVGGDLVRCLFQGRLHSFTRAKHDLVHLGDSLKIHCFSILHQLIAASFGVHV